MDIRQRNNVKILGDGEQTLLLAHGFGCNQQMWRFMLPLLQPYFKIVLFDYVGANAGELGAFCSKKYATLNGYAEDIVDICNALDLTNVILVGHSVSGTIGLLAAQQIPQRIVAHVMVCPSPCFLNIDTSYQGGFETDDLHELLDLMDKNYIDWAHYLAPLVTGEEASEFTEELTESFCSTNPITAKVFAKATFFADYRDLLPANQHPALLIQSEHDSLASVEVGEYMQRHTPHSQLVVMPTNGHCLHMSHPHLVAKEIRQFLHFAS